MGPALCSPERPPSADWEQEAGQEAGQEADRSVLYVLVVTQTDETKPLLLRVSASTTTKLLPSVQDGGTESVTPERH